MIKEIQENLRMLSKDQLIYIINQDKRMQRAISNILIDVSKSHINSKDGIDLIRANVNKYYLSLQNEHLSNYIDMKLNRISEKEYREIVLGK